MTPTYGLEKAIADWCSGILGETEKSTRITTAVLDKIKNLTMEDNSILTTYNFEALYPSLQLEPVCIHFY